MRERYAVLGGRNFNLFLYIWPKPCESKRVSSEVVELMISATEKKHNLFVLGDIHSHPDDGFSSNPCYSAIDLYPSVRNKRSIIVQGLVEGDSNLFVFRTRESTVIPFSSVTFSPDSFAHYWHQYETDGLEMNVSIAVKHKLVMYLGKAGKDLVKLQKWK